MDWYRSKSILRSSTFLPFIERFLFRWKRMSLLASRGERYLLLRIILLFTRDAAIESFCRRLSL